MGGREPAEEVHVSKPRIVAGGRTRPRWHVRIGHYEKLVAPDYRRPDVSGVRVMVFNDVIAYDCDGCGRRIDVNPEYFRWVVCEHCGRTHWIDGGFEVN